MCGWFVGVVVFDLKYIGCIVVSCEVKVFGVKINILVKEVCVLVFDMMFVVVCFDVYVCLYK